MTTTVIPSENIWRSKDWSGATAEQLANKRLAEVFGWKSLSTLMGGSLAIAPIAVRPHLPVHWDWSSYYIAPVGAPAILDPFIGIDGQWYNRPWEPLIQDDLRKRIRLPEPVGQIEWITIDGEILDAAKYQVLDGAELVRLDGKPWPVHQDMFAAPDAVGSFVVSYFHGAGPNELDVYAAGVLASEFLKTLEGNASTCRLPKNVTNVSRQGVTYDIDVSGFSDGKSGIPEVDAIVSARNPYLLRTPSIVMSVDTMPAYSGRVTQGPGVYSGVNPGNGGTGSLVEVSGHPGYYELVASA